MNNQVSNVHVSVHTDGKLQGFSSISTASWKNPFCQAMQEGADTVCSRCYTKKPYLKCRKRLADALERNHDYLTTHELTDEEAAAVPIHTLVCRIESFGGVKSVLHAVNLVLIAKMHPLTTFGVWTKRPEKYISAFNVFGKPSNLRFIVSSPLLNKQIPYDKIPKYADRIFTVWEKDKVPEGLRINCGGKKCATCMLCYNPKRYDQQDVYINELLK